MAMELNFLEEIHLSAEVKNAIYKQRVERYYNSQVKVHEFRADDLVLRRVLGTPPGVLVPIWEVPYRVTRRLMNGAYKLKDMDDNSAQYPYSDALLKKYYQ
ncbi:hypothetical protein ACS0TY_001168 [Phlomoides rotata]